MNQPNIKYIASIADSIHIDIDQATAERVLERFQTDFEGDELIPVDMAISQLIYEQTQ
jgi:hypothetical protein